MEDFQTFRAERIEGLSGIERQTVEDQLTQLEGSIYRDSFKFEADRRFEARKSETRALLDIASNAVFSRPQDLARIRGGIIDDIDASDLPEFAKKALAGTATAALAETYFAAEVERDPYGTMERLTKGEDLQGLEISSRITLLNKADSNIRSLEAEQKRVAAEQRAEQRERESAARAARQEAQYYARSTIEDELAAAQRGETANPQAAKIITEAFGDKAAPYLSAINTAREAAGIAAQFATMTAAEIGAAIETMAPAGAGFKDEAQTQDGLRTVANKVLAERASKPAEAVLRAYPGIAQALSSGDPAQVAQGLRQSAAVQAEVFGLPADQVRVLPPALVDSVVSQFKTAGTADERLALITQYTTGLGDDEVARRVLGELEAKGLPPGARLAAERAAEGDVPGAREILAGLTTDPKDLPKLADTKAADVAAAVDARMAEPGPAGMSTRLATMSRQPGLFARSSAERAEMQRLATQYAAAGDDAETAAEKAERVLFGDVQIAGDDDLGYVRVPQGADPAALTAGMERLRSGLDLTYLAPTFGETTTGAAEGERIAAVRDFTAYAQSIRDGGIFTDAEGGYALMAPNGRFIPDPSDPRKPRIFTAREITDASQRIMSPREGLTTMPAFSEVMPGLGG